MREKVIRGGTAVILRQLVSLPINALGVTLVSRLLLPADFGVQAVLAPAIALAVVLIDLGTSQALVQSRMPPTSVVLRQVQLLKALCGFLVITTFTVLSSRLAQILGLSHSFVWLFPACGLLGWLQSQRAFQAMALHRKVDWQSLAKVEIVEIIIYNCAVVAAAYVLRSAWCFVAALGLRIGVGVIMLRALTKIGTETAATETQAIPSLLRFGIPLQAATLYSVAMNLANPVVVGSSLGMVAVGLVNWSNYIVSLPQLPLQPLPSFLFSVLSERRRQERDDRRAIENVAYIGTVLMAMSSLIVVLSLELLVRYAFGIQWLEAIPAASILVLSNVLVVPSLLITAQLNVKGHTAISLIISGLGVLLMWMMIGVATLLRGGLIGYALGVLCSSLVTFAVQCSVASRRIGIRVKWHDSLRLIAIAAFCVGTARLLSGCLPKSSVIWGEVTEIAIAIAGFAALAFLFEGRRLKQSQATIMGLLA